MPESPDTTLHTRYAVARRADVPPFHVMDLLAAADRRRRTHGDLVNFVAGPRAEVEDGLARLAAYVS